MSLIDLIDVMRKADAVYDPDEANALLTAAADEIQRLRAALERATRRENETGT